MNSRKMPQITSLRTPVKPSHDGDLSSDKENTRLISNTSSVKKKIQVTPKPREPIADIVKPSPMSMVFERQPNCSEPKRKLVSLAGSFVHSKEAVAHTLKNLKYEISSPVTKDTIAVIRAANIESSDKLKLQAASTFGIPVIDEETLFSKPEEESETESEEELLIDEDSHEIGEEEVLMVLDDVSEDEQLLGSDEPSIPKHGERLKGKRIAFVGKFETSYFELKQNVLSQGGQVTAMESLILPPSHIVLAPEYGSPKEFIAEYYSYWWIRSAVFLNEDQFLNVCSGIIECPAPKKRFTTSQSVQKSMKRLSLDEKGIDTICAKRKVRPPTTPKKKDIKPLFAFGSPEKKRGRTEQMENLNTFQFASTRTTPSSKPAFKFPSKCASTNLHPPQETVCTATTASAIKMTTLPKSTSMPSVEQNITMFRVNEKPETISVASTKLEGKIIVLMGKFKQGKREICNLITAHSGTIPKSSHLSCKISYLLCGIGAEKTQKYQKAKEKGITIISEEDFLKMIA